MCFLSSRPSFLLGSIFGLDIRTLSPLHGAPHCIPPPPPLFSSWPTGQEECELNDTLLLPSLPSATTTHQILLAPSVRRPQFTMKWISSSSSSSSSSFLHSHVLPFTPSICQERRRRDLFLSGHNFPHPLRRPHDALFLHLCSNQQFFLPRPLFNRLLLLLMAEKALGFPRFAAEIEKGDGE